MKLFLTGEPGCGKTTVLETVVSRLRGSVPMTGFLTREIRERARRTGFQGITLDGRSFTLASLEQERGIRVGPYSVRTEELDAVGVPALDPGGDARLVVLDEVGKMESFSAPFRAAVERLLAGDVPLLATVAAHGVGFPKKVRSDPRITLIRMRRDSRDGVAGDLLRRLRKAGILGEPASRNRSEER